MQNSLTLYKAALQVAQMRGDERASRSLRGAIRRLQHAEMIVELERVTPAQLRWTVELLAKQPTHIGDIARMILADLGGRPQWGK